MTKKPLTILAALILVSSLAGLANAGQRNGFRQGQRAKVRTHYQQQKEENRGFRQTIKELEPQERTNAIIGHRNRQYRKNISFHETLRGENMTCLTERLSQNSKLNDSQKNEIIAFTESQYQKRKAHRQQQHNENNTFITKSGNATGLSPEDRKARAKEHQKTQGEENKQFRQTQRKAAQDKRQEIRAQLKENYSDDS
ncbi:MAG: hypothetical protein KAJ18_10400 [Candidatus Omnitrophica bacterium]|nr:hypothetical protein [Candidatus Omnitrophota bacterium]